MTDAAKDFGAALFSLAKEEGCLDSYSEALETVRAVFAEHPDYVRVLASPNIPKSVRVGLIDDAFKSSLPTYVLSFLKLLCEHGHIPHFDAVKAEYDALHDEELHLSRATVTSAAPLTEDQKARLCEKLQALSGGNVEADYHIDERLLGGVVVKLGDNVIDGSLIRQIRNLKDVISQ